MASDIPHTPSARIAALWSAALAILVAAPWIVPGFIFGVDFPGPRHLDFPDRISASAPLEILLAAVSQILSAELTAKLFIALALFAAGYAAFRALPVGGFTPRAVAASIYVLNPFVYGRLQYGQLFVVAGYAVLPWMTVRLRKLLEEPTAKTSLIAAVSFVLVGALDQHLLFPAAVLVFFASAAEFVAERRNREHLVAVARNLALTAALVVLGNAYWLVALLAGSSYEAIVIRSVTDADLFAYRAVADARFGLLPNLLGLYGFWAENTGRFLSMKAFVPLWPAGLAAILILLAIGVDAIFRAGAVPAFHGARRWVIALLLSGLVAIVLEMGYSEPHTAAIARWLDAIFPPYRGLRDAGKWGALVALVYAQLVPLGVIAVLAWMQRRFSAGRIRDLEVAVASGVLLALPIYYGSGLLYGLHLQIQSSQYPAGWYSADRVMSADPHHGRALFLPWHGYLALSFVRNTDRVVANPAPRFFSIPIVASQDPQIPGIAAPNTADQAPIDHLLGQGAQADWAATLAGRGIKYVLLAREVDWKQYPDLGRQPDLTLVRDFGSIALYRNTLMP